MQVDYQAGREAAGGVEVGGLQELVLGVGQREVVPFDGRVAGDQPVPQVSGLVADPERTNHAEHDLLEKAGLEPRHDSYYENELWH